MIQAESGSKIIDDSNKNQKCEEWVENITPSLAIHQKIKSIIHSSKSKYQNIQIVDFESFGKTLVLDGKVQSSSLDERIYHESLVHPAMILHGDVRSVFIAGGGELATARELLRYKSVEKVVMVDLDKAVIEVSRKYLPDFCGDAFDDKRLEVHYTDALEYLRNSPITYDLIIFDISDPFENGPANHLYTPQCYREIVLPKLEPNGLFVVQSGTADLLTYKECSVDIFANLCGVFDNVVPYIAEIPSFTGSQAFNIAQNNKLNSVANDNGPATKKRYINGEVLTENNRIDISRCDPVVIDVKLGNLIGVQAAQNLMFYDGITHSRLFSLPKFIRQEFERHKNCRKIAQKNEGEDDKSQAMLTHKCLCDHQPLMVMKETGPIEKND